MSAFEPESLATIRRLAPAVACWLNAEDLEQAALDLAVALGCRGISVEWRAINQRTAAAVAHAGLDLAPKEGIWAITWMCASQPAPSRSSCANRGSHRMPAATSAGATPP